MSFPHFSQLEYSDCGATCLKIILKHYKKNASLPYLRELCETTRAGVSMKNLVEAAESLRFDTMSVLCTTDWMCENAILPCIVHWKQDHFVVLYKISKGYFYISDPAFGKIKLKEEIFNSWWKDTNENGIALFLEPNAEFSKMELESVSFGKIFRRSISYYRNTLENQQKTLMFLFLVVALSTVAVYLFPKTMETIVDHGVRGRNINILWAVFGFQFMLILGQTVLNWVQGWLRINLSMNVSIRMITQLLFKVIKLPVKYFDTKVPTDIFQRIEDQKQIESFLSEQIVQTFFSVIITIVLGIKLFYFNYYIGLVFSTLSVISVCWIFLFYRYRRQLDYTNFRLSSENHNMVNEMLTGMVEIKVNNSQEKKIMQWKGIQDKLFEMKRRSLRLGVYQNFGIQFLTQFKNITITFISAYWVIEGDLTIGAMLSIGYILGLLSNPIESLANFSQSVQDAQLSLSRLDEIMHRDNEVRSDHVSLPKVKMSFIKLQGVSFRYEGTSTSHVLKDICVNIPVGKVTAIVGNSGSGKTTLVKLMLNFYSPSSGQIMLGDMDMDAVDPQEWRDRCGIVLQDGFIFSGTIADNIAIGETDPDTIKLLAAAKIACIDEFILQLPLKFNTKIGNVGVGLSGGQKQRILIARAVYKNPDFIFLDEATSSLDSNNEKQIMRNLGEFFTGKTVIIIAHRLSTVKSADQILVLDNGSLSEVGHHRELTDTKGKYFELVRNQLELGN